MKPLLKTDGLEIRHGEIQVVEPLSIELYPGQVLAIIGETGSGKSLFAQGLVGNLPPGLHARGRVEFASGLNEEASSTERKGLWGREIAILPQEPWLSLDPTMRAVQQVSDTYQHVAGMSLRDALKTATNALTELGLEKAMHQFPFQLSGGMSQRLAFAATHAGGAKILIADEPTKGLDEACVGEVISLMKATVANGGAVLIITHDIEVARQLDGEVMVMLKGKIVETGTADQVFNMPRHRYTKALLDALPSRWPRRARAQATPDPVVRVHDLAVERDGLQLFEKLSFEINSGEVVGITGPSGCGKSTLGDVILELLPPSQGVVKRRKGLPRIAFQKLYQDPVAAFPQSVELAQSLADLVKLHRLDPGQIAVLCEGLRLDPALLKRLPANVSGGELQRISLLRVLLLKPSFIFADEPSSRLDLITQKEMIDVLIDAAHLSGTGILLVSHDQALIKAVCDRFISIAGDEISKPKRNPTRAIALTP